MEAMPDYAGGMKKVGEMVSHADSARRFLFLDYGYAFTDVGTACEIFSLRLSRN